MKNDHLKIKIAASTNISSGGDNGLHCYTQSGQISSGTSELPALFFISHMQHMQANIVRRRSYQLEIIKVNAVGNFPRGQMRLGRCPASPVQATVRPPERHHHNVVLQFNKAGREQSALQFNDLKHCMVTE